MNVEIATKVSAGPEQPRIRVKSFAKANLSLSLNETDEQKGSVAGSTKHVLQDIEIITVSSENELDTKKKPKGRRKRASNRLPAIPRGRRGQTPLKLKYHKIDEYFIKTKKEVSVKMNANDADTEINDCEENAPTFPVTKEVRVVLKRLQITEESKTSMNNKRLRLSSDFDKSSTISNKSADVASVTALNGTLTNGHTKPNDVQTEGDVLKINLTSDSENEVDMNEPDQMITDNNINNDKNPKANGVKVRAPRKPSSKKLPTRKQSERTAKSKAMSIVQRPPKKPLGLPSYKIVDGTKLAVDAFCFGDIDGVENYFLSHFHADHYKGLKKSFNHTLYLTNITGRLVEANIKVDPKYLRPVSINTPFTVDDVEVTALDANHCPGAVMFLFKLKTGKCILHTGDFRASPYMEEYPEFWNNEIDLIYLDTTYLSSKYEFQPQDDSVKQAINECAMFMQRCTISGQKPLIVVGAYTIGKEKVWLGIAQSFNFKVYVDAKRMETVRCVADPSILDVVVDSPEKANVHVLPLANIDYRSLEKYLDSFSDHFGSLLAIRPSGWEANSRPRYGNRVSLIGIQYSEHSSYNELHRFVRFLRPKTVISTVPYNGRNLNRTPKVPDGWLNRELKPLKQSYQTIILDFCKPKKKNTKSNQKETKKKCPLRAEDFLDSISIRDDLTVTDYMP